MLSYPLFVVAVLALNVTVSEWLIRHTALRHLGSALLVIVLTALACGADSSSGRLRSLSLPACNRSGTASPPY